MSGLKQLTTQEILARVLAGEEIDGTVYSFGGGGTLQCGHIAILTEGEGEDATEGNQVVQLPDIPCRKVVIACPTATNLNTAFGPTGRGSSNARGMFYGDATGQVWFLEEGQAEELEVNNLNEIWLRDPSFGWEDFNGDGHLLDYVVTAYWRVIK